MTLADDVPVYQDITDQGSHGDRTTRTPTLVLYTSIASITILLIVRYNIVTSLETKRAIPYQHLHLSNSSNIGIEVLSSSVLSTVRRVNALSVRLAGPVDNERIQC